MQTSIFVYLSQVISSSQYWTVLSHMADFPHIVQDSSILRVKGFTFSWPNILLLIVAKQLHFCFIWGFFFVHVISSKLQTSLGLGVSFLHGSLSAHVVAKDTWQWTWHMLLLIHYKLAFSGFLLDSWPSWPIFFQQQMIFCIFFLIVAVA